MAPIATFVFFDLEATDLLKQAEIPSITELGMIAVKRKHFLTTKEHEELRVQYKFRMCFNPPKSMSKQSVKLSGLTNELLNEEAELNAEAFKAINCLQKPVCLIAHNGLQYHFPIFKYYFPKMLEHISPDVLCADSLHAFYDLSRKDETGEIDHEEFDEEYNWEPQPFERLERERFYWPDKFPIGGSYKLNDIYDRMVEGTLLGNRAENHCTMILKIAQSRKNWAYRFHKWLAQNHCRLIDVPVPLEFVLRSSVLRES